MPHAQPWNFNDSGCRDAMLRSTDYENLIVSVYGFADAVPVTCNGGASNSSWTMHVGSSRTPDCQGSNCVQKLSSSAHPLL